MWYEITCMFQEKKLLLWVLHFTTLLIEHSFSRHLYNSMEHLNTLLASSDMSVVLGVLNLLYMFSKRSNFITRLNSEKRNALLSRLRYLAEVSESTSSLCIFCYLVNIVSKLIYADFQKSFITIKHTIHTILTLLYICVKY